MGAGDLSIGVIAELKDFKAAMAQLPNIGEQEARDMVKGIQRQLSVAEKAAGATAKATSASFKTEFNQVTSAGAAMASSLGGPFGKVASLANSAVKPVASLATEIGGVGEVVGVMGAGIAAGIVVVAAFVAGAKQLADAAVEARDRLIETGNAAMIPPGASKSLDEYTEGSKLLDTALDHLTVTVGSKLADDLGVLASNTAGLVNRFADWADGIGDVSREVLHFTSLGLADKLLDYADASEQATKATIDATKADQDWTDSMQKAYEALGMLIPDEEVDKDAKDRQTKAIEAQTAALKRLSAASRAKAFQESQQRDQESSEEDERNQERQDAMKSQGQAGADLAAAQLANDEAERASYYALWTQKAQDAAEGAAKIKQVELQVANDSLAAITTIADGVVASYERQASEGDGLTKKQRQNANDAFAVAQGVEIAQATMSAVLAGVNTEAQLALLIPPPGPTIAGAAVTAAALAGSVASIASQPPPQFPMGLAPDHPRMVGIRPDEGILTPRAARGIGGLARDLNAGRSGDGGGEIELGPRTLSALDRMLRPRSRVSVVRGGLGRGNVHGGR